MRLLLLSILSLISSSLFSQSYGDTTVVQFFNFGGTRDSVVKFPDDTVSFSKILMIYTLKCDPGTTQDQFDCGEWDYLSYSFLYDKTGMLDSNLLSQPNFTVDGLSPDTFDYMTSPSYSYSTRWEVKKQNLDTSSLDSATFYSGATIGKDLFPVTLPATRVQFVYSGSEISGAGLTAGDISSLKFDVTTFGSNMGNVLIRMKHTTQDSLNENNIEEFGFSEVYRGPHTAAGSGQQIFVLTTPFTWDGSSNILVDVSTTNSPTGSDYSHNFNSSLTDKAIFWSQSNQYLSFNGADYVDVPKSAFAQVDSAITIELWLKGDPNIQPQSDYLFEGMDAQNRRVVNVHHPWGDSKVYWDAGNANSGSYDRISKTATPAEYEEKWNHWAFVKDARTGIMEIYLNGDLWASGTGKTRIFSTIEKFILGGRGTNNLQNYDGYMDEFRVWKEALADTVIKAWYNKTADNTHPNQSDLLLYYDFNDNSSLTVKDISGNGFDGTRLGAPQPQNYTGETLYLDPNTSKLRPNIKFEIGAHNFKLDSTLIIDSLELGPLTLVEYGDSSNPLTATDTTVVWPTYSRPIYDTNGQVIGTTAIPPSQTIYKRDWEYYDTPYEVINRYEIGRYITPYGIGLDLDAQSGRTGFRWIYDVTDFRPLLADSVHIIAGNNQEFLDMKFLMIHGKPTREIKGVQNIYAGSHQYNANIETNFLNEKKIYIPQDVKTAKWRITNTGHGFGGNLNCSEFCPTTNNIKINGQTRYSQYLWRDDCASNPVYPQGGTWIYNRANWCPGAEVTTHEYEVTPYMTSGDTLRLDYDMEAGYVWNGQGSSPTWRVESQLITYGAHNFNHNADIEEIIAPNNHELYKRLNPVCNNSVIKVRNGGKQTITSLRITYGPKDGWKNYIKWTGSIAFDKVETIALPAVPWGPFTDPIFEVEITKVNEVNDEYPQNNFKSVEFEKVPEFPSKLELRLRTNNSGTPENGYYLRDYQGNIVDSATNLATSTTHKFLFDLPQGCYSLEIFDTDEDGLSFFANNDGNGWLRIYEIGGSLQQNINPNFGANFVQYFTVGYEVGDTKLEEKSIIEVFPNPTQDLFYLEMVFPQSKTFTVELLNTVGKVIERKGPITSNTGYYTFDLSKQPQGLYFVKIQSEGKIITKQILKTN